MMLTRPGSNARGMAWVLLLLGSGISGSTTLAQNLLWDNDIGPPWGIAGGRATSPPSFPNIRVVDDFVVPKDGWIISDFVATLLEDDDWISSGSTTIYIYLDSGEGPVGGGLFTQDMGPVARTDTGLRRLGRRVYWHAVRVSIRLPEGVWWIGLRDGDASGQGTAYWTTSPEGGPQESSTGWFSLDVGNT